MSLCRVVAFVFTLAALLVGCGAPSGPGQQGAEVPLAGIEGARAGAGPNGAGTPEVVSTSTESSKSERQVALAPLRNAYFGELHVHTAYSLDALALGTFTDPDMAYRFAKGEAIRHPAGDLIRLKAPLDFAAVTDHSEWLGESGIVLDADHPHHDDAFAIDAREARQNGKRFRKFFDAISEAEKSGVRPEFSGPQGSTALSYARTVWARSLAAAERHNDPGHFTTFAGFEWTATPGGANLHRNLIFRTARTPDLPVSFFEVRSPEALWAWMDNTAGGDANVFAIPHNSNISNGLMFSAVATGGRPYDAELAARRQAAEPLVEIMQIKGASESSPAFATNDELIDFELLPAALNFAKQAAAPTAGNWVREGLKEGLRQEARLGVNPFEYGFVGGTDNHSGLAGDVMEGDFHGSDGIFDATAAKRLDDGYLNLNPGAVTGVWAEANTREELWKSLKRRETFATSGTRIKVRFFGAWSLPKTLLDSVDWLSVAYQNGVPMGQRLSAAAGERRAPTFVVWALRDPQSAPLDRVQIVKGWAAGDSTHELIYDVACSGGRAADAKTHRCADNHAAVDLKSCAFAAEPGGAQLKAAWTDPQFDPASHAFYYARVLENPTCRWTTHDANRLGRKPPEGVPATIKERAWTSPIWYAPPQATDAAR